MVLLSVVTSVNGVPIRLTDERWEHIIIGHPELEHLLKEVIRGIEEPQTVRAGGSGELLAVRKLRDNKYLVVVYREKTEKDGFVITAFLTKKIDQVQRRPQVWPK